MSLGTLVIFFLFVTVWGNIFGFFAIYYSLFSFMHNVHLQFTIYKATFLSYSGVLYNNNTLQVCILKVYPMLRSWKDITWKVITFSFYGLPVFRFEWQLFFLRFLLD